MTRVDHPRALDVEKIVELARQANVESEAVSPVQAAFGRALELSEKDGSIVLSAGSMFVTAEAMRAWKKIYPSPRRRLKQRVNESSKRVERRRR